MPSIEIVPPWIDPLPDGYWLYNLSLTIFWAYVSVMFAVRAPRLGPRLVAATGAMYGVGLALVIARFVVEIPASGHAVWMYALVVLAVRLELGPWAVGFALALIVEVIGFKLAWDKLGSVAWGSAIGVPLAAFLAVVPTRDDRASGG
ncbi:MAG: hypothetical protein IPK07_11520 [Deltaproteobacteria bacterium]|nr:hypothetical protein [Deltaproteobacteria bacterium]